MWASRLLVLGILYVSTSVEALALLGCTSTIVGLSAVAQAGVYADETTCASACSTLYHYAFYNQYDKSCRCGNIAPAAAVLAQGLVSASLGVLAAGCVSTVLTPSYEAIDITVQGDVFLRLCAVASALGTATLTGEVPGTAGSPAACINSCKALGKPYSLLSGDYSTCRCAASVSTSILSSANLLTCTAASLSGGFRIYEDITLIPAGSTPLKKRDAYGKINRRKYEAMRYCPGKLAACKVAGGVIGDEYECMDVSAELESCGGCIAGWAQASFGQNETVGVDCSSLPGVAFGGVTCHSGQCKIFSCRKGWSRVGNSCIEDGRATNQQVFGVKLTRDR